MKRVEHAWTRLFDYGVVPSGAAAIMTWLCRSRRRAQQIRFGGRIVRVTITYDDSTKPKKRKAKR